MQFCFVLLVAQVLLGASTLQEKLDAVLSASEAGRRAFWGIRVVNLANGATAAGKIGRFRECVEWESPRRSKRECKS